MVVFGRTRKQLEYLFLVAIILLGLLTVYQNALNTGIIKNGLKGDLDTEMLNAVKLSEYAFKQRILKHLITIRRYYGKRKTLVTSNLGAMLFKNQTHKSNRTNKEFVILIWKYYDWLKSRHIKSFYQGRQDPLDECSVSNCKFVGNDSEINNVDAVVVHIQHGDIPVVENRNAKQIWIFLSDESPAHTFSLANENQNILYQIHWKNVFNWSMTYRSDADIPVPYGRTVALETPLMPNLLSETIAKYVPYWKYKKRDVLVTILISNCHGSERMKYLEQLKKHIAVDVYGRCSDNQKDSCPGHFKSDCEVINKYLFYLVLENAKCHQYLTEKSFNNAFIKGAIPIIMGPTRKDCEMLLPPHSFLHIDDYESPRDLSLKISLIAKSNKSLLAYHRWRNDFEVRNEHGYFGWKSYHYCRICEALNYNSLSRSIYGADPLRLFLDPKILCSDANNNNVP